MNKFKIVTCCNRLPYEDYYCLPQFVNSLGNDVDKLLVLSEENMQGKWDGLGTKPKWLYKVIKDGIIDTKYIIFTDCWDMVFAGEPNELFDMYLVIDKPIVISCEKNCFPGDLKTEYDAMPFRSSYRYLNSGMIVGETDAILAALEAMDLGNVPDDYRKEDGSMEHINDQFLWQQLFLKQPVEMVLDYEQKLCNTLHGIKIEDLDFSGDLLFNKETQVAPCSFHFNGSAKTDGLREPVLKHLNL